MGLLAIRYGGLYHFVFSRNLASSLDTLSLVELLFVALRFFNRIEATCQMLHHLHRETSVSCEIAVVPSNNNFSPFLLSEPGFSPCPLWKIKCVYHSSSWCYRTECAVEFLANFPLNCCSSLIIELFPIPKKSPRRWAVVLFSTLWPKSQKGAYSLTQLISPWSKGLYTCPFCIEGLNNAAGSNLLL